MTQESRCAKTTHLKLKLSFSFSFFFVCYVRPLAMHASSLCMTWALVLINHSFTEGWMRWCIKNAKEYWLQGSSLWRPSYMQWKVRWLQKWHDNCELQPDFGKGVRDAGYRWKPTLSSPHAVLDHILGCIPCLHVCMFVEPELDGMHLLNVYRNNSF